MSYYSAAQTNERSMALDILPSIGFRYPELFIKATNTEAINWFIFLKPLSVRIWLIIVPTAIIISGFLTGLDKLFTKDNQMNCLKLIADYTGNLWVAVKANFGGTPSFTPENATHKTVIFVLLLSGSVIWMAYTASLTSELSVVQLKLPFNDLESLANTDYK